MPLLSPFLITKRGLSWICSNGYGEEAIILSGTKTPAESIVFIHSRMPVIRSDDMRNDWLNLRYDAMDVMKAAVMEVMHRAV